MFDWLKGKKKGSASYNGQAHVMLDLAIEDLAVKEDDVILEIGFGDGQALRRMVPLLTKGRLTGIETSQGAIHKASTEFAEEFTSFRVDFKEGVASKMPFYDGQFTKVLSIDQMHTWINVDRTLDEIHRVMASGGKLVIVWGQPLDADTQSKRRIVDPEHMKQLLHLAGFHSPRQRERVDDTLRYWQLAVEKP